MCMAHISISASEQMLIYQQCSHSYNLLFQAVDGTLINTFFHGFDYIFSHKSGNFVINLSKF